MGMTREDGKAIFPSLDASALRTAYKWFKCADATEMTLSRDGKDLTLRLRDLHLIHDLAADRFGTYKECPICKDERERDF